MELEREVILNAGPPFLSRGLYGKTVLGLLSTVALFTQSPRKFYLKGLFTEILGVARRKSLIASHVAPGPPWRVLRLLRWSHGAWPPLRGSVQCPSGSAAQRLLLAAAASQSGMLFWPVKFELSLQIKNQPPIPPPLWQLFICDAYQTGPLIVNRKKQSH